VAIIGAGIAGALLALKLARDGVSVAVVEATPAYKSDFRCEKLGPRQLKLLEELGLTDAIRPTVAPKELSNEVGFRYEGLVNTVRSCWPDNVHLIVDRVSDLGKLGEGDEERRILISPQGHIVSARLVVLASGMSRKLNNILGLTRRVVREHQSVCVGFSLKRKDNAPLAPENFIHWGERTGDKFGYVSAFPVGENMRLNLHSYHSANDPWLEEVRSDPIAATLKIAPGLAAKFADLEAIGRVEACAVGLYRTQGVEQPGLVVIGDAYQNSCPGTSFGVTRVLTDIQRLCAHLPDWLATPGMGSEKIATYYADPIKRSADREGLQRAYRDRSVAVKTDPFWRAYRFAHRLKGRALAWIGRGATLA